MQRHRKHKNKRIDDFSYSYTGVIAHTRMFDGKVLDILGTSKKLVIKNLMSELDLNRFKNKQDIRKHPQMM